LALPPRPPPSRIGWSCGNSFQHTGRSPGSLLGPEFLHDDWLPPGPLRCAFPALYSHASCSEATVLQIRRQGLPAFLVPRLTRVAARELTKVLALLRACPATSNGDARRAILCDAAHGAFSSRAAYKLLRFGGITSPNVGFLWLFAWLLYMARVHTRDVLLRKTIVDAQGAGCPCCPTTPETADHLFFGCSFAVRFWRCIGVDPVPGRVRSLHLFDVGAAVGRASSNAFLLLCLWHLWKRRNAVVFRGESPSLGATLKCCRHDAVLWRDRLRVEDHGHIDIWLQKLAMPLS
jgi:hypothetical protein